MSSSWAGVIITAVIALAGFYGWSMRRARREGTVDEILAGLVKTTDRLVTIADRHDQEISELRRERVR